MAATLRRAARPAACARSPPRRACAGRGDAAEGPRLAAVCAGAALCPVSTGPEVQVPRLRYRGCRGRSLCGTGVLEPPSEPAAGCFQWGLQEAWQRGRACPAHGRRAARSASSLCSGGCAPRACAGRSATWPAAGTCSRAASCTWTWCGSAPRCTGSSASWRARGRPRAGSRASRASRRRASRAGRG